MTNVYKILGQSAPSAATDTDLYEVPSSTEAVVSGIEVCNRSGSAATFRIAIRPAGATLSNEHYIAYEVPVPGNDTISWPGRIGLAATDVVTVRPSSADLSFTCHGVEIT